MLQKVDGKMLYVVDIIGTMPELPITGQGWETPYAEALTEAIVSKVITEPGKYGISIMINEGVNHWNVYRIIE